MSNEIQIIKNNTTIWECTDKLQSIKEIYGKNLSNLEFSTLVEMGKATNLNPFLRELWAVKYGDNAAQIFIGRDGYRKSAQANPNYDYHHVEAVYSGDELQYSLSHGEVHHKQDFKNRGHLIGAYCITKRKNSSKPIYVFVELKEYSTSKSLWASKPATMIKKVAEAQCLRMAFQDIFAGSYAEEEIETNYIQVESVNTKNMKFVEGQPISQSFSISADVVQYHIDQINLAEKLEELKIYYNAAIEEVKGDKEAINLVTKATKEKKEYLNKLRKEKEQKPQSLTDEQKEFVSQYEDGA